MHSRDESVDVVGRYDSLNVVCGVVSTNSQAPFSHGIPTIFEILDALSREVGRIPEKI